MPGAEPDATPGALLLLGQGGGDAGLLVLGEDVDAALVALFLAPRLGDEGVDDGQRLLFGVHAAAEADELGVVVLAGQAGGLRGPGQGAARTLDLVRRDLLTIAGTAEDDAERARVVDGAGGGLDAEGRVVVLGVVGVGASVDHLVPGGLQVLGDGVLGLEAGVVRPQVDAHDGDSATRLHGSPRQARPGESRPADHSRARSQSNCGSSVRLRLSSKKYG